MTPADSVAAAAPPLGEDDFEIHLMEANVHGVIAPRAEQIEAMMQGHAESRLSLVARIALASLVLQAALSPLLAIVALRLLSRAKAVRLSLFSVLIAVPRPIAARFSQLPVSLGALEDELEGPAEPMQPQRSRAESKRTGGGGSVRDLLAVPISYAKVQAARTRLQAGAKRERGRGRRWVWVGAVLAPFALWTAVVTALQVITLRLKVWVD